MKGKIPIVVVVLFASACASDKQATKGRRAETPKAAKADAATVAGGGGYDIQSDWDKKIGSVKIDSQADRVGAAAIDTLVMGGPASAPKIADYLADTSPVVREKAVKALASFGQKAEPALGRIAQLCRDPDPGIRTSATKAAALIGHRASKGILERAQDDKAPGVRIWANAGLARLGDDCADRLEEIAELLGTSPRAAEEAAEAMAVIDCQSEDAVEKLAEWLSSGDERIRAAAVTALGTRGAAAGPAVAKMAGLLGDDSLRVRVAVLRALARIGPSASVAVEKLVEVCDDRAPKMRQLAADALGSMGPAASKALPVLEKLKKDPVDVVAAAAARAIRAITGGKGTSRAPLK